MPTSQDDRERRANERTKRREQAAADRGDAGNGTAASDEPGTDDADAAPGDGGGSTLRTGAGLAAAGALVGAAIGAANAIRSRSEDGGGDGGGDGDDRDETTDEEAGGPDDAPAAAVDAESDETADDAESAGPDASEPEDEPRAAEHDDSPEAGAGNDDSPEAASGDAQEEPEPEQGTPLWMMRRAREQLGAMTGREVEGVLGLERSDGGWVVRVEVVELRRIPSTTDVLGVYDVELDESGEVAHYRRTERYIRSQAGGEGA